MAAKNNALNKPVTLSGDLENVIGKGPADPRRGHLEGVGLHQGQRPAGP